MTDKQIRDRIVGVLSASMMPLELENLCVNFLDRCLDQVCWHPARELPALKNETYVDEVEVIEYQISEPVLAFTDDGEMVAVRCSVDEGKVFWTDMDGSCYIVTHWRKLPQAPEVEPG